MRRLLTVLWQRQSQQHHWSTSSTATSHLLALSLPLCIRHNSFSNMSKRSIDSFFTKVSTPKNTAASSRTAATSTTSTTATITTPSSSDSGGKRKRSENGEDEDVDERGDKKVKENETDGAIPIATVDSTITTTTATSAVSSSDHWTAALPSLLDASWQSHLSSELTKPYFKQLCAQLLTASKGEQIFPPSHLIFHAFTLTPFDKVSVVILGQDPYHDNGQAEGLAFSVPQGVRVPSSLQNIYKELGDDIPGFTKPRHGNLTHWAEQGVLLLNTTLTVTAHKPTSHSSYGWTKFTDAVIQCINREKRGVVFILWGAHAQKKTAMIDSKRHHILKSVHPSGLSASRGFFGSRPFSKCNAFLRSESKPEIDWQV